MTEAQRIGVFVETVWHWFPEHKRVLPWRDLTIDDPSERTYRILVSEVMLQQTQVSRVKIVYKEFLETFPKMRDLAVAGNRDVILAWRGMGYNNRAIRLRDASRMLLDRGVISDMEGLCSVPGIGHYTAAAVRNFGFNIPTPCLDTNIRRILHRVFFGPEYADGTWNIQDAKLLTLAEKLLAVAVDSARTATEDSVIPRDARNWHAALMDFGSLICTKRNPKWDSCPLTRAGVMKAAYKEQPINPKQSPAKKKEEPGRMIGAKYVPNRIIRGRIVEELRDAPNGLFIEDVGSRVCIDWSPKEHDAWLCAIIQELSLDAIIRIEKSRVMLRD